MQDPDQFSTDLGKCVQAVADLEKATGDSYQLVIIGGLTGRLDQTIHTIHALTELLETRGNTTWAIGGESLACVLGPVSRISLGASGSRVWSHWHDGLAASGVRGPVWVKLTQPDVRTADHLSPLHTPINRANMT